MHYGFHCSVGRFISILTKEFSMRCNCEYATKLSTTFVNIARHHSLKITTSINVNNLQTCSKC